MNKIIPLQEMIEEIKKHYNLNDTLLALNLKVTPQTVKGWKDGNIPREKTYNKILEIYNSIINSEEQTTEVTEEAHEIAEEKKPYEISYPESGTEVYYFDDYTGDLEKRLFDKDDGYDKYLYEIGLYFQTEQQAEQFIKEQTLIKKIKCYAKEQQGDWQPNWEERTTKYFINILHDDRSVSVRRTIGFDVLPKLPHFKTEEIAQACIDEFGDEIVEVFC